MSGPGGGPLRMNLLKIGRFETWCSTVRRENR